MMSYPMREFDADPRKLAEQLGLVCIEADDHILQLDIDTPGLDLSTYDKALRFLHETYSFMRIPNSFANERVLWTRSKSGNLHAYVELEESVPVLARINMQMLLGSDKKREAFSMLRVLHVPDIPPVVLFETEQNAAKYIAWRHLAR